MKTYVTVAFTVLLITGFSFAWAVRPLLSPATPVQTIAPTPGFDETPSQAFGTTGTEPVTIKLNYPEGVEADILGVTRGVHIVSIRKYDPYGRDHGHDFYAVNPQEYPMQVQLTLTEGINVSDGLLTDQYVIPAEDSVFLGFVRQVDREEDWRWWVKWVIFPDCDPDNPLVSPECHALGQ